MDDESAHDRASGGPRCLVTGATGYIGGRLVPELLAAGYRVRVMTRSVEKLRDYPWIDDVEVAEADATDTDAVGRACEGVDVVYYLIHAIGGGTDFEATDRKTATTVSAAAAAAGVSRIVYLGGLLPADEKLSKHLRSRAEVGQILLDAPVPAAVLQAAMIVGSGSASFEMLRYLTERLPAMITPKWVHSRIQPIAIRDVLRYLVGCAALPAEVNRAFDIGGPDVLDYLGMMRRYAKVSGLRRRIIVPVPVLSPWWSAHWVGLVTPVPNALARPLVESLINTVVVTERDIAQYVPDPPEGLLGFDRAVQLALVRIHEYDVPTRWSSASLAGAPSEPLPTDPDWAGGSLYVDERSREVDASPAALWRVIEGIGGEHGWYSFPLAWTVRGLLDKLVGGVGLRRGRRNPFDLYVGEALDFWRVEALDEPSLLRLRAEMRLPGLAWLELRSTVEDGHTIYHQRALFHPRGLAGQAYWWSVAPFHGIVFGSMARNIARAAETLERTSDRPAEAGTAEVADAAPATAS